MEIRKVSGPFRAAMMSGVAGGGGGGPVSRFNKMTIHDLAGKLAGQRVLVRVDFNVSDPKTGDIKSDTRIKAALPTIQFLKQQGAIVTLISHNERPKDLIKKLTAEGMDRTTAIRTAQLRLSLHLAAKRLGELLGEEVLFLTSPDPMDPINPEIRPILDCMPAGKVIMLENTRFYEGDEKGDMELARKIVDSTGAQIFVMDGFSAAHRGHVSVTGAAQVIQERGGVAVAGDLLQKEIEYLGQKLIEAPRRPYVAFMGGAKVADKIKVIDNLLENVDTLVIGGAMIYPFLRAKGEKMGLDPLGRSEEAIAGDIESARRVLTGSNYHKILLPWRMTMSEGRIKDIDAEELVKMLDQKITRQVGTPGTIIWNGPFGQFELAPYDRGTLALLDYISQANKNGAITITGGGDTEKMLKVARKAGVEVLFSHISTGGGAMLELLEGRELPGIAVLNSR